MTVITVAGEVDERQLGVVLPHEHLLIDLSMQWEAPARAELPEAFQPLVPGLWEHCRSRPLHYYSVMGLSSPSDAVQELAPFIEAGGQTIVELTNWSLGRKPTLLRAISQLAGVNIVMGTGEYREMAHSSFVRYASVEQLRDMLIAEIVEGTREGIRAGIIGEIGTSSPMTDLEAKVLTAAARAQLATGVALNIHRTPWPDADAGLAALDLVLREGVDPAKVIISHCDEREGSGFALAVGARGAYISCDTFGMRRWAHTLGSGRTMPTDEQRLEIVRDVLDAGYLDRLLLSQDVCQQTQLVRHGGLGYGYIDAEIAPRLLAEGATPADIAQIRITNPAAALSVAAGAAVTGGEPLGHARAA